MLRFSNSVLVQFLCFISEMNNESEEEKEIRDSLNPRNKQLSERIIMK